MQPGSPNILLEVLNLTMRFGGLTAVDNVSFKAISAGITAIIGPNGAGKTTLFNCITGFYRPTLGQVNLLRADGSLALAGLPAHKIARAGIRRTFQNIRLFSNMTALENLLVAQHATLSPSSASTLTSMLGLPADREREADAIDKARFWLSRTGLESVADRTAAELPYGMQRKLEIARAMCSDPQLLCLDEPAAGLNLNESSILRAFLAQLRDDHKTSILLIEHNMSVVMGLSDHVVVLDYGRKIAEGTPAHIRTNDAVIRAYLGEPEAA